MGKGRKALLSKQAIRLYDGAKDKYSRTKHIFYFRFGSGLVAGPIRGTGQRSVPEQSLCTPQRTELFASLSPDKARPVRVLHLSIKSHLQFFFNF